MEDSAMTEDRADSGALTLGEVAERVGGRVVGDPDVRVGSIGPVDETDGDGLAFLGSRRYTQYVGESKAGAFLVADDLDEMLPEDANRVVVSEAYPAMRTLLQHFHPERPCRPGVHPTAVLGPGVELGVDVVVGPFAVLEESVSVGDRSRIGAHSVLGRGSVVGRDARLYPHVVLYEETVLGDRVTIHSGARLGTDGFGYTVVDGEHAKIPQVGRCVVGDDVEIGANSTLDRGSLGDTRIGSGSKLDNLVQIAHNVRVGARSLLAAMVGIAGSTRLGEGVFMGGQSGAINAIEIGDGAKVAVRSCVIGDLEAGGTYSGTPARPHWDTLKAWGLIDRLPELSRRVKRLERAVEGLENG
ncbi:MAG: UDP-3-O-(3-hydroxymyristoyl)glucosamine N-acyltransferase [Gemmatimonadetes bacterium]|nr:UDP-3-O-(3-hydroxymyristoyl)glucosamine N-acyltransferase [Gemmatimonadota bacterium]